MKYRREIDGLRAVAVMPVILFHAGFSVFSGGYIGVDVFFVISGYLITTIIITELDQGNFSILRFYERRARRILPALFFVMAVCIPFAWAWMLPEQLESFSLSIVAVSFFTSNILFWRESNYFAPAAEEKPLLHTWSLAVEEQYYLFFPVVLILLWRFGRRPVFHGIVIVSFVSVLLAEWGWRNSPVANFYLAPTRAWELLAGSICAFLLADRRQKSNNALSSLGLALIFFSIFVYDKSTPFPSAYTIIPVAGTALIILYGTKETWTARLLSTPVFVAIGLISYSAYLWHQPLFAFARIRSIYPPEQDLMLGLAAASLGLAYLSWRFVEQPFRKRAFWIAGSRRAIFSASGIGTAAFIALGLLGVLNNGYENRVTAAVRDGSKHTEGDTSDCHNKYSHSEIASGAVCVIGDLSALPRIAVIGDSHAARLTDALSHSLEQAKLSALVFNGSWCAPLMGFGTRNPYQNPDCILEMQAAFNAVIKDPAISVVVLFAQWPLYIEGYRGEDTGQRTEFFSERLEDTSNAEAVAEALAYTLQVLENSRKRVVLVRPTPEYVFDVPDALMKTLWWSDSLETLNLPLSEYAARNKAASAILDDLSAESNMVQVDPSGYFCNAQTCMPVSPDGISLYEDSNHLSYEGSLLLIPAIMEQIENLLATEDTPKPQEPDF